MYEPRRSDFAPPSITETEHVESLLRDGSRPSQLTASERMAVIHREPTPGGVTKRRILIH